MPHSARTNTSKTFYRSIDIGQDVGNVQILSSYLVTPNATQITRRILDTLLRGEGGAWTITGAFGTGKSSYFVFLSNSPVAVHPAIENIDHRLI